MDKVLLTLGDLIDKELGVDQVTYGVMTDKENNLISLDYKNGLIPLRVLGRANGWIRRPFLQVRVRNEDYLKALQYAHKITNILEKYDDDLILEIVSNSDVLSQGRDEKNRTRFLLNFTIHYLEEE